MLTQVELLELIANGENSGVEFKRDAIDNVKLARELVAFANFDGGVVLLGVEDDGEVSGIQRFDLEAWVMTACRDKIKPEIIPHFQVLHHAQSGKQVAVVKVERGFTTHHLWHDNHRTYFIRVGSQSREASQDELARLMQQRQHFRADIAPISGSSLHDLDRRRLVEYFERVRRQPVSTLDDEGWRVLLDNTEFLVGSAPDSPCTLAALLLFGRSPGRFLPQAGADLFAFGGTEKDYESIARERARGPMVALRATPSSGVDSVPVGDEAPDAHTTREPHVVTAPQTVELGLVEQAVEFVARFGGSSSTLRDGAVREDRPTYHPEVVREAVVNAFVHRDYLFAGTTVEVSLYSDRLEIVSPGRLPNGITPERMRAGCRASRNPMLRDVMQDYGYLESSGMGVPRKILKLTREHNGTEPDLIATDGEFRLKIFAGPAHP